MQIAIMMSVGAKNLGDELILKNEIKLFENKYPKDTKFVVFTYDINNIFYKKDNITYVEYFPIGIRNIKNIKRNIKNYFSFIKVIKESDKIIIGGGGIMFDNEKGNFSNPLKQWLFRSNIIKKYKKDLIIYGVSIDIKDEKNFIYIKKIFKNANEIYVRDENSHILLTKLGIKSEIIFDPVFYDAGEYNTKKNFLVKKIFPNNFNVDVLYSIDLKNKKVGIAFREGYIKDEEKLIKKLIDYLLSMNAIPVLLPHSFHSSDKKVNDYLFLNQFKKDGVIIKSSLQEVYNTYKDKKIDFSLSMRLHSMILCSVYEIPFISLNYSLKTDIF